MKAQVQTALALLLAAVVAHSLVLPTNAKTTLVVFGDSLSDTGNYLKLTKGAYPDPKWFKGGRSSGGHLWPDILQGLLPLSVKNYAYYGGNACPTPDGIDVTGLPAAPDGIDQVNMYLKSATPAEIKSSIHVVFLGPSDYIQFFIRTQLGLIDPTKTPPPTPETVIPCIMNVAKKLLNKGATKVLFTEIPPAEATPLLSQAPPLLRATAIQLTLAHANALRSAIKGLKLQYPKAKFLLAKSRQVFLFMYRNPKNYGFVNVTGTALKVDKRIPTYPFVGPSGYQRRASRYMWFDGVHPTPRVHTFLAGSYRNLLRKAKWV